MPLFEKFIYLCFLFYLRSKIETKKSFAFWGKKQTWSIEMILARAKIFTPLYFNSPIEHKQSRSKYATPPQIFMIRVFNDHKTYTIVYFHISVGSNMSTTWDYCKFLWWIQDVGVPFIRAAQTTHYLQLNFAHHVAWLNQWTVIVIEFVMVAASRQTPAAWLVYAM